MTALGCCIDPSGLAWYKPWTWGVFTGPGTFIGNVTSYSTIQETQRLENAMALRQKKFAAEHPECNSERARPTFSQSSIQHMQFIAETGIQPEVAIGGAQIGSGISGVGSRPTGGTGGGARPPGGGAPIKPTPPTGGPNFYSTPGGQLIEAPPGYVGVTAQINRGLVLLPKGQQLGNNCNIIRYGEATSQYPKGYFRYYNQHGQPLNPLTGKPGTNAETHIPIDYQGPLIGYPGR